MRKIAGVAVGILSAIVLLGACNPDSAPGDLPPSPSAAPVSPGTENCPLSPAEPPDLALRGDTNAGQLWAMPPGPWQPSVDERFQVTLKVTGSGDLAVTAIDPDGEEILPSLGPVRQFGTDPGFARPGTEWDMVFDFQKAGCWQIEVRRGDLQGRLSFEVANRP